MKTAAALVIGNELLSGKIAEGNVLGLARVLRGAGVVLRRVVMIPDEMDVIVSEVLALSAAYDVVFTSGGVGPTHDDLTTAAVAKAFGVDVVMSPRMEELLRGYYADKLKPGHLLMARIPDGARLVASETIPWPTVVMKNVWVLPGVPEIFAMKLPLIAQELAGDAPFVSLAVYTTRDEGEIKDHLDRVVSEYPDVEIGSYPVFRTNEYRTKLTFDGKDEPKVRAARDAFASLLPRESIVRID